MACILFPEWAPGSSGTVPEYIQGMTDLYPLAWFKCMDLLFPGDSSECYLPSKAFDTVCHNIAADRVMEFRADRRAGGGLKTA